MFSLLYKGATARYLTGAAPNRSDWQIAKHSIVDPFDSAILGRNMRGRQRLFRFVTRQNTVEVPVRMASTPTASTPLPINILHALLHRRGFSFDAMWFVT